MTTHTISIGYNSGDGSLKLSRNKSWLVLKRTVEEICADIASLIAEARKYNAPEEDADGDLQDFANYYKLPWQDQTIYFDEKLHVVIQNSSGRRNIKEHLRRAFCRLVMQKLHQRNIEININVI